MNAAEQLHSLGQSLWLDNISRGLLLRGTLREYIDTLSITGLTSNPTIFDNAIRNSGFYDAAIRDKAANGRAGEELFNELALEDLTQAADEFRSMPGTINTMPETTLHAFVAAVTRAGVDTAKLAARLQREGAEAFSRSWRDLLACMAAKSVTLAQGRPSGAT